MNLLIKFFSIFLLIIFIRAVYILPIWKRPTQMKTKRQKYKIPISILSVIGSGGHTAEMLKLLDGLLQKDRTRYYQVNFIVAKTDKNSKIKIEKFIQNIRENPTSLIQKNQFKIFEIPRSREVGQSFISCILPTIRAFFSSLFVLFKTKPKLLLVNGPGTCVPVSICAFFIRVLFLNKTDIIYVESVARVKSLSLSGLILYIIADRFLVQWTELYQKYSKSEYIGRLF
ncbi:glycosyl transferase-related [Anaeramoeba ignava]|uniref:UDP-N-acetylglucosamine transferase subunit ALG14 n=1 Tax=Anaeramoeba ignava TaxID=1746090 RepID=A0A9Q0LBF2_ANAIG|nr:glycosyl transferase-related [Anaeramoeba ignava]